MIDGENILSPNGSILCYTNSPNYSTSNEALLSTTTLFLSSMAYLRDLIASDSTPFYKIIKKASIIVLSITTLTIGSTLSIAECTLRLSLASIIAPFFIYSLVYKGKKIHSFGRGNPILLGLEALYCLGNVPSSIYLFYMMLTEKKNLDILDIQKKSNFPSIYNLLYEKPHN
jgi:hypothetical protein